MDAMTMSYKVDNAEAFKNVKVGDTIEATVYDGDITLYKVHAVAPDPK
jgi:Cu/Ag efflux protein CusF